MNRKANRATSRRAESDRTTFNPRAELHRANADRAAFDVRAACDLHAFDPYVSLRRAFNLRTKCDRAESHRVAVDRATRRHANSDHANSDHATSDLQVSTLPKSTLPKSTLHASTLHTCNLPPARLHPIRLRRTLRRSTTLLISGLATASLVVTLAMAAPGKPLHHHRVHTAAVPPAAETPPAQDTSPVVARMGSLELHADQTQRLIANLNPSDRAAIDKNPDLLARVLRGLIADRFVLAQALAKHWDQQPAVAAALERMRENAILQSYVQAEAAPPPDYPDEADLAEAYEANKAALMAPKQYEVAQIFVAAKTGADSSAEANTSAETQAREKILAIARELRTPGADFATIAKTESQAKATAANGGIIGWLSEAQLRPEIKTQVLSLAKGAVSAPIRLDDGWQILKLVDVREPRQLDLGEVHDVLKQKMRQQRAQDLQRAWLADLVKANPISLDQSELTKLVGAAGAAAQ